jgi:hypothetical protein
MMLVTRSVSSVTAVVAVPGEAAKKVIIAAAVATVAFFSVGGVALADTGDSGSAAAGAGYFGTVGRQIGFIPGNLGL